MKNLILTLFMLLSVVSCFAANNIKMVTYFPVPYVSYNDLQVLDTCDVGLTDTATSLNAGGRLNITKSASDTRAKNKGQLEVMGGELDLNGSGQVDGNILQVGSSGSREGTLKFRHNLNITNIGTTISNIEAGNRAIMDKLVLFGKEFPTCDASNHEVSWQNLTINGTNGVFLVCGAGKDLVCRGASSRSCGCYGEPNEISGVDWQSGRSFGLPPSRGTQTRTCNKGKWSEWSTCSGYTASAGVQCHSSNWEWNCVYNASSDSWAWTNTSQGSDCDWDEPNYYWKEELISSVGYEETGWVKHCSDTCYTLECGPSTLGDTCECAVIDGITENFLYTCVRE